MVLAVSQRLVHVALLYSGTVVYLGRHLYVDDQAHLDFVHGWPLLFLHPRVQLPEQCEILRKLAAKEVFLYRRAAIMSQESDLVPKSAQLLAFATVSALPLELSAGGRNW